MQRLVGLSGEEMVDTPWKQSVSNRTPWLFVNLFTAFLAAAVVSLFEDTIASYALLAVFLPIVAGQGGNAGSQTLTIVVRALALGEVHVDDRMRILFKEMLVALCTGLATGVAVGLICWMWKGNALIGGVIFLAMLLNMLAAAVAGVLVPLGLKTLKVDPALASGIMVTTVTDVVGFFLFLGLATAAIAMFPGWMG
jgi:magnesium transporter